MSEGKNHFIEKIYTVWGIILILWSLYRWQVRLPEWIDELLIKPLLFVLPVILFVYLYEKKPLTSLGLSFTAFVRDLYIGFGFGVLFAVEGIAANLIKHGTISLAPVITITPVILLIYMLVSLAGAFCEEILIRGFFYTRLRESYQNKIKALFMSTVMYFFLLIPIIFTRLSLTIPTLLVFLITNIIISVANTYLFEETKSITAPTLVHAFWNLTVLLYL